MWSNIRKYFSTIIDSERIKENASCEVRRETIINFPLKQEVDCVSLIHGNHIFHPYIIINSSHPCRCRRPGSLVYYIQLSMGSRDLSFRSCQGARADLAPEHVNSSSRPDYLPLGLLRSQSYGHGTKELIRLGYIKTLQKGE